MLHMRSRRILTALRLERPGGMGRHVGPRCISRAWQTLPTPAQTLHELPVAHGVCAEGRLATADALAVALYFSKQLIHAPWIGLLPDYVKGYFPRALRG